MKICQSPLLIEEIPSGEPFLSRLTQSYTETQSLSKGPFIIISSNTTTTTTMILMANISCGMVAHKGIYYYFIITIIVIISVKMYLSQSRL